MFDLILPLYIETHNNIENIVSLIYKIIIYWVLSIERWLSRERWLFQVMEIILKYFLYFGIVVFKSIFFILLKSCSK